MINGLIANKSIVYVKKIHQIIKGEGPYLESI
jgi:hypothetical protein